MEENEEKLPEKIERLDMLRVERGYKKLCTCIDPTYEIDATNRLIYCTKCKAIVEPYDALYKLSSRIERIDEHFDYLLDVHKQLANYKPRLKIIKQLETQTRRDHGNLEPLCPHCGHMVTLEELSRATWINKNYYRDREEEGSGENSGGSKVDD